MPTVTPIKAWPDRTGKLHASVEEWRIAELEALVRADYQSRKDTQAVASDAYMPPDVARFVDAHADCIIAILTTGPRSRPSTRKRAGTTNPRRATRTQAAAGFKAMRDAVDHGGTNATRDADVPAEPVGAD